MKAAQAQALQPSSSAILTREDLKTLKAPFPKDRLGVKVQSTSKDRSRALLVLYLQHTDVQDRLEEVDPAWTTEVLAETRADDLVVVRMRLTVKGVSRENVGEGGDPKAAYSDALKRCAMLFGVGRYLYDSETVWVDYDESRDRFRHWSAEDYDAAAKAYAQRQKQVEPSAPRPAKPPAGKSPVTAVRSENKSSGARPREELNRHLMNLYRPFLAQFPGTQFPDLLKERYNVGETRLMTVEQLEDLVRLMDEKMRSVA